TSSRKPSRAFIEKKMENRRWKMGRISKDDNRGWRLEDGFSLARPLTMSGIPPIRLLLVHCRRRRKETQNSRCEQHEANELFGVHPLGCSDRSVCQLGRNT